MTLGLVFWLGFLDNSEHASKVGERTFGLTDAAERPVRLEWKGKLTGKSEHRKGQGHDKERRVVLLGKGRQKTA